MAAKRGSGFRDKKAEEFAKQITRFFLTAPLATE
jgi:hypothetical protein